MKEIHGIHLETVKGILGVGGGEHQTSIFRQLSGQIQSVVGIHLDIEEDDV